jgi:flagellar biosynthesis protein FlhG
MTAVPLRHPASEPRARNIIAVASGKGGVGKTWLSVTLSHALARQGRRVLLLDADLGLANVDVQLGIAPEHDLGAAIAGRIPFNQAVIRHHAGFDVLAGRSGSGALAALPALKLHELRARLSVLANRYDVAIMDLGAGIEPPVRLLSEAARTCLVVATDEPTSLTDAYAFMKVTAQSQPDADLRIVVNMAPSRAAGERTHATLCAACSNFLGFAPPLVGVIRRDAKVPDAIRAQSPLMVRYPSCDAAADVEALARGLIVPV